MAGLLAVTIEYDGVLDMKQRDVNRVVRDSMASVGMLWRRDMLPGHFTKAGARKYGYTPRHGERMGAGKFKRSYTGRKLKEMRHTLPLVYTGKSRQEALSSNKVTAKATATRASVTVPLPVGFNRRAKGSQVRMADEIRAVTQGEIRILEAHLARMIDLKLQTFGHDSGTRVRIAA